MAATKRKTKSKKGPSPLERTADLLLRPELLGLALVVVSVFTLLSLLSGSRGKLTDAWVQYLDRMVGLGAWGVPLVFGAIGMWIIIRAVDQMPDLPWQRPTGIALMFLAYLTGSSLLAESVPEAAGGVIGSQLANMLETSFGAAGAWTLVSVTAIIGLILLTDRMLADAGLDAWYRLGDWWSGAFDRRHHPVIQPNLPMPSGRLPWWKRQWEKFSPPQEMTPPNHVSATPQRQPSAQPPRQSATTAHAEPQEGPAPAASAQQREALLTPHVVGHEQEWALPAVDRMLNDWDRHVDTDDYIRSQGRLIQETLGLFGVPADFEGAYKGPAVTQYLIKPGYIERSVRGEERRVKVKVSKIASLANDLALALAAPSVRIEAPVPGTSYVGVEVPNHEANVVGLKDLMDSEAYRNLKGALPVALGEDVKGQSIVTDLARMPHLLIAGATGSGKSVCINSIITCLLLTNTPDDLRLLMIDPKMVELNMYNDVPHLLSPVVNEVDRASSVLFWGVKEMERRYQLFSQAGARDIIRYNAYLEKRNEKKLPYIVVIVDEMADLMMASPEEVEKYICRLAQMARAVGIHLIIATQRPSVDVITGLIKANFPARIAFAVSSQVDSRVILDVPGADRLLGRGDMLFMAPDASKLERIQGAFLGDDEIMRVVHYWKGLRRYENPRPTPADGTAVRAPSAGASKPQPTAPSAPVQPDGELSQPALFTQIERMKEEDARDDLFDDAVRIVQQTGRGSVSLLQRKLRIGYSRASRLVEQLEEAGVLGPDLGGNQGRELLVDEDSSFGETPRIIGGEDAESDYAPPSSSAYAGDNDSAAQSPRVWM